MTFWVTLKRRKKQEKLVEKRKFLHKIATWRKCPVAGCSGGVQWCSGASRVSIFSKLDTLHTRPFSTTKKATVYTMAL
jgi:hypothetical protein